MAKSNFPNKYKSHGAKKGEYGEWLIVKMPFLVKKNPLLSLINELVHYRATSANFFKIFWPYMTDTRQQTFHNTKLKHSIDRLAL